MNLTDEELSALIEACNVASQHNPRPPWASAGRQAWDKLLAEELRRHGVSASHKSPWPTFSEYGGGGILLSPTTLPDTVDASCSTRVLLKQVRDMLRKGFEVIIRNGHIVAAQEAKP